MVSELYFAKFLEILTTGSLEIGKFLQKFSSSYTCAAVNWVLLSALSIWKNPRIGGFFASLLFLIFRGGAAAPLSYGIFQCYFKGAVSPYLATF